jgi:hypothetical protein
MLTSVDRKLPPEYAGWERHEPELRRMSTPELIEEIQDGPPDRRLAAISVIDRAEVAQETVADWIRTLPDAEANELAGAIPAQRLHAAIDDDIRWIDLARMGYERRRLPTFLVMLFHSVEALEARDPEAATRVWQGLATWAGREYRRFAAEGDDESVDDLLLFVFENYIDREALFHVFTELLGEHAELALRVSANPAMFLAGLSLERQRLSLEIAAASGGLPFDSAWRSLHQPGL